MPQSPAVTRHRLEIAGERLDYTARAGTVTVPAEGSKTRGRIFFVAYTKDGADPDTRPITFVFNGGPGAASAYLHLLALGPRVAVLREDGTIPPPPVRTTDNPSTWLAFTDLVFVDPVGTGYSRTIPPNDAENGKHGGTSDFWSLEQDLDALGEFIRLQLTRMQRWGSPKFLTGESYGGFRAALLTKRLAAKPGVRLNGIVLISPVLEFSLQDFDPYRLLPWASLLPAYAATALHHGKSGVPGELQDVLGEAESFAMGAYLTWLAQPHEADGRPVPERLARLLGLSSDLVARHRGRIPRSVFAKRLLGESQRVVSLYDGTIASVDPHPASPFLRADDPILKGLTAPLTAAFNTYVRERLQFETDVPYRVLNPAVGRHWEWTSDDRAHPRPPGAADSLKEAMSLNGELRVLVVHGAYDMVTPYLASRFVVRQMALDAAVARNLIFRVYEGGHMPYTHAAARAALYRDARDFFERAAPGPGAN